MKKSIEVDLPDIQVLSDKDDVKDYILRQASKGKKITTQSLSTYFRMPERTANQILNDLEKEKLLQSTWMRVLDIKNNPKRMRVFFETDNWSEDPKLRSKK